MQFRRDFESLYGFEYWSTPYSSRRSAERHRQAFLDAFSPQKTAEMSKKRTKGGRYVDASTGLPWKGVETPPSANKRKKLREKRKKKGKK